MLRCFPGIKNVSTRDNISEQNHQALSELLLRNLLICTSKLGSLLLRNLLICTSKLGSKSHPPHQFRWRSLKSEDSYLVAEVRFSRKSFAFLRTSLARLFCPLL